MLGTGYPQTTQRVIVRMVLGWGYCVVIAGIDGCLGPVTAKHVYPDKTLHCFPDHKSPRKGRKEGSNPIRSDQSQCIYNHHSVVSHCILVSNTQRCQRRIPPRGGRWRRESAAVSRRRPLASQPGVSHCRQPLTCRQSLSSVSQSGRHSLTHRSNDDDDNDDDNDDDDNNDDDNDDDDDDDNDHDDDDDHDNDHDNDDHNDNNDDDDDDNDDHDDHDDPDHADDDDDHDHDDNDDDDHDHDNDDDDPDDDDDDDDTDNGTTTPTRAKTPTTMTTTTLTTTVETMTTTTTTTTTNAFVVG